MPTPRTYRCPVCPETITEAPGVPFAAAPTHTHADTRRTYLMTEVTPTEETTP
jgi:hypothetical protein